uniref:non-specific serine/threonine protein kinase n=1 Tax=Gouania willdenowi TaxID=441366 RepID=A0A8C5GIX2_GOUWI
GSLSKSSKRTNPKLRRGHASHSRYHTRRMMSTTRKKYSVRTLSQELLGEGGYSQVYAGEYVRFARVFLMEQAAGRLCDGSFENPAVIGLMDTFELETEVIIVMERPPDTVDGHDYMFKVKHVPEDQVKIIFKQIINAALLMHKNGVFHRDLKLENLLVDRNKGTPEIRVIDFGCGDFVENEPFREFNGTPDFAPPEVCRDETYRAEATTVWQIGVMLYMICTRDSFETLKYMEQDNKVLGNVSKKCNDFLSRCLAFYPSQRPTLEDLLLHPWLELTGPHSNDPVLEVQEYSCHQPEAMKTTFHRNSVVLSSRKEFTSSGCCSNLLLPPRQNRRPPSAGSVHAFSVQQRRNKVLLIKFFNAFYPHVSFYSILPVSNLVIYN